MTDRTDQDLQRAFATLRNSDRRRLPSFEALFAEDGAAPPTEGTEAREFASNALQALLEAPAPQRAEAMATAERQLGTRGLLESLVAESAKRVRNHPKHSAELARWAQRGLAESAPSPYDEAWRASLGVRAEACEANALRVLGDLKRSRRIFLRLADDPRREHLDPLERAQLARLEASLYSVERNEAGALRKMAEAEALYREAGDSQGLATCLIKRANLAIHHLRAEESLELLEQASALLDPEADSTLHLSTVIGRINALCDLDQPDAAETLLSAYWPRILASGDRHVMTLGQNLRGRIALEQGRFTQAEPDLRRAVEMNLEIGRHLDAALACHSLAETLLALGKLDELRTMTRDALELFQVQGVTRDALAALRQLAKAAQAETVTLSVLTRLRHDLEAPA